MAGEGRGIGILPVNASGRHVEILKPASSQMSKSMREPYGDVEPINRAASLPIVKP